MASITPQEAAIGLLRLAGVADDVAGQSVSVSVEEDAVAVFVPTTG